MRGKRWPRMKMLPTSHGSDLRKQRIVLTPGSI